MAETMRASERAMARRNLDKRLSTLRDSNQLTRPPKGWIKAIREALGMSAAQLATRIGVQTPRVYEIEKSETMGSLSLDSLQRAANAMDCQLVYALVPRQDLETMVQERALEIAVKRAHATSHTMALEDQAVDEATMKIQIEKLASELLEGRASIIWED